MEIELKLTIAASEIRKLSRSGLLRAARRSPPVTRRLYSVYYDTAERTLARAGMALRLRKAGRRWIQTFKCGGGVGTGLHQREEYEAPTPAQLLNLAALSGTPAARLFSDPGLRERISPVFVTDFRRTTSLMEIHPGEIAELAIDTGTISARGVTEPIREIELELKDGTPVHLFGFARKLLDEVDLRLENASKAERGYALLAGLKPAPIRAVSPPLEPATGSTGALREIAGACLAQLMGNERGVLGSDDPEYVHQSRVGIRRLRSAFNLFRPLVPRALVDETLGRFRTLALRLGAARDWDVFVAETLPPIREAFPGETALARLAEAADASQQLARKQAREALAARDHTRLLLDFALLLHEAPWQSGAGATPSASISESAPALLRRQWKRMRRAGATADRNDAESLHALRIEIKKMRYALEFFEALLPARGVRTLLQGSAELQDILGRLNDEAITGRLLATLDTGNPELSFAAGLVRGWTHARATAALDRFETAWRRLSRLKPCW
ncbi:MAG: CHAD domain-containing protein [Betaproteobacteria bacterium]